ncbi:hypothetical protein V6N13_017153 [Hibiscus sabdariffa]|uniref:Uncharacterized protein n=2 Tax=Hibiscus sabdariffa TaxID=183260 RepID=A0ABR1Z5L3_9ROSI
MKKAQTAGPSKSGINISGSRFNPIFESDEINVLEHPRPNQDQHSISPQPPINTKNQSKAVAKSKGKDPVAHKTPKAFPVRKPVAMSLSDFPVIHRNSNKANMSRHHSTHPLNRDKHSSVVMNENAEPDAQLVIKGDINNPILVDDTLNGDPPDPSKHVELEDQPMIVQTKNCDLEEVEGNPTNLA